MLSTVQTHFTSLARDVLKLSPGIICLTGGGGKSTLMYTLGAALSLLGNNGLGSRVLLTTTTRIMRPGPEQSRFFLECSSHEELALPEIPCVLTAARPAAPGQNPDYLRGFTCDEIDGFWQRGIADWIIVEADGSARRPLKAPSAKEPVIPPLTKLVIAVAGLSAFGKTYNEALVFRTEEFSAVTGLNPGDILSAGALAPLFIDSMGLFKGCPDKAKRMVFLNQADASGAMEEAIRFARSLLPAQGETIYGVYAGSAKQAEVPCLRLVMVHPTYIFFEAHIKPAIPEVQVRDHFLPEGLSPNTGSLRRIELESKRHYACLDFYGNGQLDINVMEKLGQGPLMQVLTAAEDEERQKQSLERMKLLLQE